MARKSLIQREKKRQKLEQKYHLIRRSSKKEISKVPSLSDKWEIHGKLQSPPRNSAPTRLHRRCFLTGRPRLIIETLGYPETYFVQRFMHVCCRGQQDQVGKDSNFSFIFLVISTIIDHRGASLPFCINVLFYLYRYGRGAHSILVCPLVPTSSLHHAG